VPVDSQALLRLANLRIRLLHLSRDYELQAMDNRLPTDNNRLVTVNCASRILHGIFKPPGHSTLGPNCAKLLAW
jgi:hypothetical protein